MQILQIIQNAAGLVQGAEKLSLERAVRKLFIIYFLHISNQEMLETPGGSKDLNLNAPVKFNGQGKIRIGDKVTFGVINSPGNMSYSYIAALNSSATISFGSHTSINNRASIVAQSSVITIGDRCLIGPDCIICDSNSHDLIVARRLNPDPQAEAVSIGNDVFIGARVIILKGAHIGNGCVIGAGSVLPPGFKCEDNKIVAGNPARVVSSVPQ
ncbi:MAG TPA: acyltransferase [Alphaproteobacteria bacterium]